MLKALLKAILEPTEKLKEMELDGDYTSRLALTEEFKTYPWQAVWNYYCYKNDIPVSNDFLDEIWKYEEEVLSGRN
ncbi:L-rhamnose isomerase (RhaA) [Halanaerobium congolense]|nr:L-rhamnose isomerase (RhaA) [Halanaerobium congolense]